jgi:hypothetical protein
LNPSVLSVGKIPWRHHAVAYFQTKYIFRRWSRRYIPMEIFRRNISTELPTEYFRRYIPTDFETELYPSVIPLLFSGFLVVLYNISQSRKLNKLCFHFSKFIVRWRAHFLDFAYFFFTSFFHYFQLKIKQYNILFDIQSVFNDIRD